MTQEITPDDILLGRVRPHRRRRHVRPVHNKRKFHSKFLMFFVLIIIVSGIVFSFADVGGNIILSMAENFLSENYKLKLTAEKLSGNPVKGYTLHNFEISPINGEKILSAEYLSGRVNFGALLTGKIKLAEISLGGFRADVEKLIETAKNFQLPTKTAKINVSASPAFAAEENGQNNLPEIPLDRFYLTDSHLTSQYGVIEISNLTADLNNFDIEIDGKINGLPFDGKIDMGEVAGITAINRSELNLGSGKVLATGGLTNDNLDFHASLENLDIKELTQLHSSLISRDFEGTANINVDVTGKISDPKISGTIDYKGSKIYGFIVERFSSNFNYSSYRFAMNNIQANALNIPVQGEIAVADRPDEKISVLIKLDGSEANLSGLDEVLKIPALKKLSGKVSLFNANISGHVDSLNGLVNFTAPRIAYDGRALTNIKAQMKLAKSDTANVDGKFNFEGANGYLNGNIASVLTNPKLDLTAKIADLDIKRVENMIPDASDYKLAGKITASVSVKGKISEPSIQGSINSPEFSGFEQKITKPVINFSFANKTLTLSKTEGTLNGMPVNLSGTISPLPSSNPNLNINATVEVSPNALKSYVPDINQYAVKGTVNAGIKIQGSVNKPSINFMASSKNLQAMNMITAKDIELTTAMNGDLTKLEKINVKTSAKSITASGITFSNVNASLNKSSDKIILDSISAKSGEGNINGSGSASISGKENLNFSFNFNNLSLASLASASGVDVKGNLSGNLKISGSNTNPSLNLNAKVPSLNAVGFALNDLIAEISGNMQNIKLNNVRASVEGAEIKANGNVQISPSLKINVALNGNKIRFEKFLKDIPALKDNLSGIADFTFNINGNDKKISGTGVLTSPAIKAWGINLTGINLPLSYSGNNFASNNGTAKLYGGNAKNNFTFDISAMKFSDNIDVSGINVNSLIQDVSGGLEGKITGTGKLTMKINGSVKDKTTYSGSGNFSMGSGGISGFKWLDIVTKIHNTNGINYSSVNAPLTLQTGKLILRSGTIARANNKDPIYTYAKLSQNGIIDFGGNEVTLNLMTESNVNYQLINAIQGGSVGGFSALFKGGVSNWKDGIKTFMSEGLKQAKKVASTGDFRIVTLKISGKAASPSFSNLKIGASKLKDTNQSTDKQQEDFKEKIINRAVDVVIPDNVKKDIKENIKNEIIKRVTPVKKSSDNKSTKQVQSGEIKKDEIKKNVQQKIQQTVNDNKEKIKEEIKKGLGGLFKR